MRDRNSTSSAHLPAPAAGGHSSSTPHLFVFQPSDDPALTPGSALNPSDVTYVNTTDVTLYENTRTSLPPPEPVLPSRMQCYPLRPGSVYSSIDDRDPRLSPEVGSESQSSGDLHPALCASLSHSSCRSLPSPENPPADTSTLAVSEADIAQVESFFSGHNTKVLVCRALANMYLSSEAGAWELKYTGIPAVLVDTDNSRSTSASAPYTQLVLAEKGTGFMLWRDVVDDLTGYAAPDPSFHTVQLSSDRTLRAGFSYDDVESALKFQTQLEALCAAHAAEAAAAGAHERKRKKKKKQRYLRPRKEDISSPCCFQHVTRVTLSDMKRFYTLQSLVDPPGIRKII